MQMKAHRCTMACALQLYKRSINGQDPSASAFNAFVLAAEDTSGASTSEGHPTTPPLSRMGSSRLYTVPESSVAEEDTEAAYEAARQSDTPAEFRRRYGYAHASVPAFVHGGGHSHPCLPSPEVLSLVSCPAWFVQHTSVVCCHTVRDHLVFLTPIWAASLLPLSQMC